MDEKKRLNRLLQENKYKVAHTVKSVHPDDPAEEAEESTLGTLQELFAVIDDKALHQKVDEETKSKIEEAKNASAVSSTGWNSAGTTPRNACPKPTSGWWSALPNGMWAVGCCSWI